MFLLCVLLGQNSAQEGLQEIVFICCKSCAHRVFFFQNCVRSWRQERRAGGGCMCGRVDLEWRGGVARGDFGVEDQKKKFQIKKQLKH